MTDDLTPDALWAGVLMALRIAAARDSVLWRVQLSGDQAAAILSRLEAAGFGDPEDAARRLLPDAQPPPTPRIRARMRELAARYEAGGSQPISLSLEEWVVRATGAEERVAELLAQARWREQRIAGLEACRHAQDAGLVEVRAEQKADAARADTAERQRDALLAAIYPITPPPAVDSEMIAAAIQEVAALRDAAGAAERERDAVLDAVQRRGDPATLALVRSALGSADLVHDSVTAESALDRVREVLSSGADPVVAVGLISGVIRRAHPDSEESLRARQADLQRRVDGLDAPAAARTEEVRGHGAAAGCSCRGRDGVSCRCDRRPVGASGLCARCERACRSRDATAPAMQVSTPKLS